jgi:hypothetical protein
VVPETARWDTLVTAIFIVRRLATLG